MHHCSSPDWKEVNSSHDVAPINKPKNGAPPIEKEVNSCRTLDDRERRSQRRAAPGSPSTSHGTLRAPRRQTGWHVWGWSFEEEGRRARKEKLEREHMRGLHTSILNAHRDHQRLPSFSVFFLSLGWPAGTTGDRAQGNSVLQ